MMIPQIVRSVAAVKLRLLLWRAPVFSAFLCLSQIPAAAAADQSAAPAAAQSAPITGVVTNSPNLVVTNFSVRGFPALDAASADNLLSKYTGTNVPVTDLVKAAADIQAECEKRGRPGLSVAILQEAITNGTATLNLFPAVVQQILISGKRYVLADGEARL